MFNVFGSSLKLHRNSFTFYISDLERTDTVWAGGDQENLAFSEYSNIRVRLWNVWSCLHSQISHWSPNADSYWSISDWQWLYFPQSGLLLSLTNTLNNRNLLTVTKMGFVFIIKDLSCYLWWTMVTLETSLKEGNINFKKSMVRWTFCQFYVKFKGFMKLKLVSIEACQNVKNEFDNNMSNLSECSKWVPDKWLGQITLTKLTPQPTLKMFQIVLVRISNVSQTLMRET